MRALTPWRPFTELSHLHHDLDDLFTRFFGEEQGWWSRPFDHMAPSVESLVRGDELVVRVDLPGINPKDVELAVEGDRLTIKGERKQVEKDERADRFYREVSYGRFERTLTLPTGVDPETMKAVYHNGVLEITMKAPKGYTPKKVPITVH